MTKVNDDAYDGRWNETIEIRRFVYIPTIFYVEEKKNNRGFGDDRAIMVCM